MQSPSILLPTQEQSRNPQNLSSKNQTHTSPNTPLRHAQPLFVEDDIDFVYCKIYVIYLLSKYFDCLIIFYSSYRVCWSTHCRVSAGSAR